MNEIKTANTSSAFIVSSEEANDIGATKSSKNNSVKISSAHVSALIALATKEAGGAKGNMAGGPVLRVPVFDLDDAQSAALASTLCDIRDEPDHENKMDALRTQAAAFSGDITRPILEGLRR